MALTLERIQRYYEDGEVTRSEVLSRIAMVLTDENIDQAAEWFKRFPEFDERELPLEPAREWWWSSGVRTVLTEEQVNLMRRLSVKVHGGIFGPDGIAG